MFYWRLAHSTSDFLQENLWCYFGENFLYDAKLIVPFNGKNRFLKDTLTNIFALYVLEFVLFEE